MTFANWRMSTVLSPTDLWTFTIGECPVGESLIGEIPESRFFSGLIPIGSKSTDKTSR
jgi:hypothetical protein